MRAYSFGALDPASENHLTQPSSVSECLLCKYEVQTVFEELVDDVDARRPLLVVVLADELVELNVQLRQPVRNATWREALPLQVSG